MNHAEAKSATLTATDLALEVAADNGIDRDSLFSAAHRAISGAWCEVTDEWGEATIDIAATVPPRVGPRFVRFMARFGGPDCEPTPGTVTIMTLFEAFEP